MMLISTDSPAIAPSDLLFRAALLAGLGARSHSIPFLLDSAPQIQRTCIEAGSALLLAVKSTEKRSLRVFQLSEASTEEGCSRWIGTDYSKDKTTHSSTETFFKNRTASWEHTFAFAQAADRAEQFQHYHAAFGLKGRLFQTTASGCDRWVSWQLDRLISPQECLTCYGYSSAWTEAKQLLQALFGRSILPRSTAWSLACNLAVLEPHFKLGTTLWARLPETPVKHRQMAAIVQQMGGDDRFAEALYKLLDSARTRNSTRIGRAVEIEVKCDRIISAEFYLSVPILSTTEVTV